MNDRPLLKDADWPDFGEAIEEPAAYAAAQSITLVYPHHMGTVFEAEREVDRLTNA